MENNSGNKNTLKIVGVVIVLILVLVGGIFYLDKQKKSGQSTNSAQRPVVLPKEVTVRLTKSGFEPKTVTINAGNAVRWVNESGKDATVNSNDYPTNRLYKALNLGTFGKGSTLSLIFTKAGTYGYHNQFNAKNTGSVTVK
jgi:plastocyanin